MLCCVSDFVVSLKIIKREGKEDLIAAQIQSLI